MSDVIPVVEEGQPESITDEALTFIAVTWPRGLEGFAALHAMADRVAVGTLKWDIGSDGEVSLVYVQPFMRRRGVGTALWQAATWLSEQRSWPPPAHSHLRTPDGDAWARAVGGDVPVVPELEEPFEDPTEWARVVRERGRSQTSGDPAPVPGVRAMMRKLLDDIAIAVDACDAGNATGVDVLRTRFKGIADQVDAAEEDGLDVVDTTRFMNCLTNTLALLASNHCEGARQWFDQACARWSEMTSHDTWGPDEDHLEGL